MEFGIENNIDWIKLAEIFVMMFGAFLIGYFFGKRKTKHTSLKTNDKPKIKEADNINDIATIFSEIKPEIIKIIENHKKAAGNMKNTTAKRKAVKKELNFESFGYANETDKDDLTKIDGISPFIEEKLNQLGIYSYGQISKFTDDDIATVTHLIEYFPGRIERDDWVGRAKEIITKNATP